MTMNKFKPNQRVVLNVSPSDLIYVNCGGVMLTKEMTYHIKDYVEPFNGHPMVRLKECGEVRYLESIFREAQRKRIVRQFERLSK